jgi:hypothetical protein
MNLNPISYYNPIIFSPTKILHPPSLTIKIGHGFFASFLKKIHSYFLSTKFYKFTPMIRDRPEPSWLHTVNKYEQLMALKNFETYYLLVFERKKQKKEKHFSSMNNYVCCHKRDDKLLL